MAGLPRRRAAQLAAVCLIGVLAGCSWGPGTRIADPVLPGADILSLVHGNTFRARTEAGADVAIYYRDDGEVFIRGLKNSGEPIIDSGIWSVESDRLCTRWNNIRRQVKTCEWVTSRGGVIRTYDPIGNPTASGRLEAGNPNRADILPRVPPVKRRAGD